MFPFVSLYLDLRTLCVTAPVQAQSSDSEQVRRAQAFQYMASSVKEVVYEFLRLALQVTTVSMIVQQCGTALTRHRENKGVAQFQAA